MDTDREDAYIHTDRLQRARQEMGRQGIDALLAGPSADLCYLTGLHGHLSERLNLLVLPSDGPPSYVVPVLEAPLVASRRDILEIHTWSETEAPAALAARLIGGGDGKTIAVGDQLWSVFLVRLQDALPGARWVEAGQVLRPLRMVKDDQELDLLKEAARRTDEAWVEFVAQPLSRLTERQAIARLMEMTTKRGLLPGFGSCCSGPNSASPHHQPGERVIQAGDTVLFDWGGILDGYWSDVTRTVHVGEPGEEFRRVYDAVLRANQAALEAIAPGVPCEAIDRAGRAVIAEAGYGDQFIHRLGHGLGLDVHEEPYLVSGNTLPLQAGMVFSDEPGVYLEGRFGVRIEDTVVCTAGGGERLNHAPRELTVVG